MDAWIKVLVVLILISALSMVTSLLIFNPFVGLILMGIILTLLVLTVEPATGKAMAQVTIPVVIILFILQVIYDQTFSFDLWMLFVIGAILYLLFAMFTGGGGVLEGGFIDAKISLKLFPIYGAVILVAVYIDPSYELAIIVMASTIIGMMLLFMAFLRGYEKYPTYDYRPQEIVAFTDISPKGKVKMGAEIWWARTVGPPIAAGERVRMIGMSGMTMVVVPEDNLVPSGQ